MSARTTLCRTIVLGACALPGTGCMGRLYTESEIAEMVGRPPAPFLETRTVDAGGMTIRYAELGSGGETAILLHGFPETLQSWRRAAPALAARLRVLAPDLPGSGGTSRPDVGYTPREMADFVRDFMDAAGVRRAHLVGTDTGLSVAVAFAAIHPERTGRVVLAAGTVHPEDIHSWEIGMMRRPVLGELALYNPFTSLVVRRSMRKGYADRRLLSREMYEECIRSLKSRGGRRAALRTIRAFIREAPFLADCARKIESPTLLVYADRDCFFAPAAGQRLTAEIPGARFQTIAECGHFLQEERPDELNDLILDFLTGARDDGPKADAAETEPAPAPAAAG